METLRGELTYHFMHPCRETKSLKSYIFFKFTHYAISPSILHFSPTCLGSPTLDVKTTNECFVVTRTHFSAPTQSLWSGHSCGGNFSFGGRSFGCLGLFPLLRSAIVMLTRVNCLQLQNHEVIVVTVCMRSWKPKGLSINSELITCCGVLLT